MSRRVIALALAIALLASMMPLQGCQLLSKVGIGGGSKQPFTTDYTLTQADYDFFVGADTVDTAIAHSPFYPGNMPLPSQNTAEYENARYKKVQTIVAEADALYTAAKASETALAKLRSDYVTFLAKVGRADTKASEFVASSAATITAFGVQEILAATSYESLKSTEATTGYAITTRDYLKVSSAMSYAALLLEDGNTIAAHAALLSEAVATNGSAESKAAAAEFDGKAEKDVADAVAAQQSLATGIERINAQMDLLASADYYFSREALGFMASETAKLAPQVAALTPRGDMTQANVDDIKTAFETYKQWNSALTDQLKALDTSHLVAVKGAVPFGVVPLVGTAYAADGVASYTPGLDYGNAVTSLGKEPEPKQGLLGATWSGVKNVFGKLKTGVGVGLDVANVGVKNIETAGANWWYGVPVKETWKQWKENVKEIGKNYDAGVSGSGVLTTASGYLDTVEQGAGDTAGGWVKSGIESKWGKGKIADTTGWAVGGLVKITTGMFTGMAKGIYKVANKSSSSGDVASGLVEIGLSCVGGSKVLVKGTQIPGLLKGGYQGLKNVGKVFVNLAESAGDAKIRAALTKEMGELLLNNKLTKEQVAQLISNSVKVEISNLVSSMMARNRETYIKIIRDLIAAGGSAAKTNFVSTAKGQIEDLISKSFAKSLQGVLDAGTTVIGAGLGDYIDNVIASQLDPVMTDLINAALAIAPDPEQVDGGYVGYLIITKVDIPEEFTKQAKDANCAALFKQLEGKKQALTLKVSATGGTATMASGKNSSTGSCSYSNGAITMKFSGNGSTITLEGVAKLTKDGVVMSGGFSMPYPKTKIMISGSWSATKK